MRWLVRYTAQDRQMRLAEARASLSTCSQGSAATTRVARMRLERFLRDRGYAHEADRIAAA